MGEEVVREELRRGGSVGRGKREERRVEKRRKCRKREDGRIWSMCR